MEESWIDSVSISKAARYVFSKFPQSSGIQVSLHRGEYFVTFFNEEDELNAVKLDGFTTSIEGKEIDKDWISIVRDCNAGRTIDGLTYDQDLVSELEMIASEQKRIAIKKAEDRYKREVARINSVLEELKIKEGVEIWR